MIQEFIKENLTKEIKKANFPCQVYIKEEVSNDIANTFLYDSALDNIIEKANILRLPLAVSICPEMNKMVQVKEDQTIFYINSFIRVQKDLNLDDEELKNVIKESVIHERRHIDQFHWLRKHNIPANRWYFDDKTNYGEGTMEQDAFKFQNGYEYDINYYMSKYHENIFDRILGFTEGYIKTIGKCNKASIVCVVKLIGLIGGIYLGRKIISNK